MTYENKCWLKNIKPDLKQQKVKENATAYILSTLSSSDEAIVNDVINDPRFQKAIQTAIQNMPTLHVNGHITANSVSIASAGKTVLKLVGDGDDGVIWAPSGSMHHDVGRLEMKNEMETTKMR